MFISRIIAIPGSADITFVVLIWDASVGLL
jgi:hypothetical protein